ncbi:uncharacterized protein LOC130655337 [Hydractinia symbiolongicarpus]|uniref:uncharacterized protein LOC130655337 n=1 Tax=Hydractinia symbiolongicarpus TaxID=13093 RepID=UPI00254ED688|nr:uncharacterized protein LOC130655337 [Hydractinia symbiolongicarpus]
MSFQYLCGTHDRKVKKFSNNLFSLDKLLTDQDYHQLQNNPNFPLQCAKSKASIGGMFARDQNGKLALLFYVNRISAAGCWGYYLHLQEGSKIQQEYFNFHNIDKDFQKVAYLQLSTSYNFTVIPLPNGPPKHLVFTSPSPCVFELIYEITMEVGKSNIFDGCGLPGKNFQIFFTAHQLK